LQTQAISEELRRKAEKIEEEIKQNVGNFKENQHMMEERGIVEQNEEGDEEMLYSGVVRDGTEANVKFYVNVPDGFMPRQPIYKFYFDPNRFIYRPSSGDPLLKSWLLRS